MRVKSGKHGAWCSNRIFEQEKCVVRAEHSIARNVYKRDSVELPSSGAERVSSERLFIIYVASLLTHNCRTNLCFIVCSNILR